MHANFCGSSSSSSSSSTTPLNGSSSSNPLERGERHEKPHITDEGKGGDTGAGSSSSELSSLQPWLDSDNPGWAQMGSEPASSSSEENREGNEESDLSSLKPWLDSDDPEWAKMGSDSEESDTDVLQKARRQGGRYAAMFKKPANSGDPHTPTEQAQGVQETKAADAVDREDIEEEVWPRSEHWMRRAIREDCRKQRDGGPVETPTWCTDLTDWINRNQRSERLHLIDLRALQRQLEPHVNEDVLRDLRVPEIQGPGHEYDMTLVREQLNRFITDRATWRNMPALTQVVPGIERPSKEDGREDEDRDWEDWEERGVTMTMDEWEENNECGTKGEVKTLDEWKEENGIDTGAPVTTMNEWETQAAQTATATPLTRREERESDTITRTVDRDSTRGTEREESNIEHNFAQGTVEWSTIHHEILTSTLTDYHRTEKTVYGDYDCFYKCVQKWAEEMHKNPITKHMAAHIVGLTVRELRGRVCYDIL